MSELMHYGRKGMKWYQHIFGEIDKRAAYASAKLKAASEKAKANREAERLVERDKKTVSSAKALRSLSTDELKARIDRLNLEKQYKDLVLGPNQQQKNSVGKKLLVEALSAFGKTAASSFGKAFGEEKGESYKRSEKEKREETKKMEVERAERKAKRDSEKETKQAIKMAIDAARKEKRASDKYGDDTWKDRFR